MRTKLLGALAAAALGVLPLVGCYASTGANGEYVAYDEPPPLQAEYYSYRPGYFWVHGNWARTDGRWAWNGGRYERERPGYAFREGRWEHHGQRYTWRRGGWENNRAMATRERRR